MPGERLRAAVAMSGGVDSSVAAALVVQAGFETLGLTARLWDGPEQEEAALAAAAAADSLGIPHRVVDLRRDFGDEVLARFCGEYLAGRTPNPCTVCNPRIKFGRLAEEARRLGYDYLATGHYAGVSWGRERTTDSAEEEGRERGPEQALDPSSGGPWRYRLRRGADPSKDQSYVLYGLTQEQLSRSLFPVGRLTKDEVRRKAALLGIAAAEREESQDACFLGGGSCASFISSRIPGACVPGPVVDESGRMLGRHPGIAHFTVGQRKGLGLSGGPYYVSAILPDTNTIVVSGREAFRGRRPQGLRACDVNWVSRPAPGGPVKAQVKVRYTAAPVPAVVRSTDGGRCAEVVFGAEGRCPDAGAEAGARPDVVSPGQAVVFYDGPWVLGGGTIAQELG